MPRFTNSRPHGGILTGIMLFMGGLLIGMATVIGLQFAGVNLNHFTGFGPPKEKQASEKGKSFVPPPNESELRAMMAELTRERERFAQEQKKWAAEQQQIALEKTSVEQMKKQIDTIEKDFTEKQKQTSLETDEYERKNLKRMAKMWSQMEPAEVMSVIKDLTDPLVARVLYSMSERQSAGIVAALAGSGETGSKRAAAVLNEIRALRETDGKLKTATVAANTEPGAKP